ncbi:MAG: M1 family aminopeptidase [Acidobacteriota bacterium]|nr:M1 family aminopeptidase [Acidobacteriota bacterium]
MKRAGACLASLFALALPARTQPTFEGVVKDWSQLGVKESRPVKDLKLAVGHATLTVKSGSAAYVVAGGETVGIFVRGEGALEYLSADTVEFPILKYNLSKNSGLKPEFDGKSATIRDRFTEVLWLAGGVPLPPFPEEGVGSPLAEAFSSHVKKFNRVHTSPASHQFAAWRLNGPDRPFVRAELAGGDEDLLYVFDGLDGKSESLSQVRKNLSGDRALADRLDLVDLSDQPIGRDRRDPILPRFVLSHVDLSITASDKNDVAITATETFNAVGGTPRVLLLDLYDTRFAYNNIGSLDPRKLKIRGVFDESGAPVPFDHAKNEVAVGLPSPLVAGAPVKLRFELEGDILYRPGGDNFWELGVEPWFPQPDLSGQYYTVHATLKVKKPFIPFLPGKTVRRVQEGEFNVLETRIDKPVQFMVALAGKYAYEEETQNGVTVRIASYGLKDTIGIRKLMKLSHKIIDYFSGFLGPFPFDEFNVIEINSWGFGQAPPGFMFITQEVFNPIGGDINQLFSQGTNERFAHEIAHQYWGHVVKMASREEQWLTESFAEICAGLLVRDLRGISDLKALEAVWKTRAKDATDVAPIPLANRIRNRSDSRAASEHRTSLLYSKGPWLLDTIRREIGDKPFLVFLNSCQATFRWKFGSTKMVQAVLEAVTKKDWKPFFDDCYWGTGMPK